MKHLFISTLSALLLSGLFVLNGCGGPAKTENKSNSAAPPTEEVAKTPATTAYDPERGAGKWDATNVKIGDKLDAAMAAEGEKTANVKCTSCHRLTDEKLVGPGWKGVTERRKPEWIMNFITNVDEMLDKDPAAQAQLEICLVRMPNQNLTDTEARNLVEFMRKNDGIK